MESLPSSAEYVSSSRVRLKLLFHLITGPKSPSELASIERKHISHVSRALAELRAQGLIEPVSVQSRERRYRATMQGLKQLVTVRQIARERGIEVDQLSYRAPQEV